MQSASGDECLRLGQASPEERCVGVLEYRIVGLDRHRNMDDSVSIDDTVCDHSPDGVFLGGEDFARSAAGNEAQEQIYEQTHAQENQEHI